MADFALLRAGDVLELGEEVFHLAFAAQPRHAERFNRFGGGQFRRIHFGAQGIQLFDHQFSIFTLMTTSSTGRSPGRVGTDAMLSMMSNPSMT